jgi:hypothetical protein
MFVVAAVAAIAIGAPEGGTLDRVQLAVDGARGTATLSLAISSPQIVNEGSNAIDVHEGALTIDVPHGARIVGMTMGHGGKTLVATAMELSAARERYRDAVEAIVDPALLELVGMTPSYDRLRLRVYPLAFAAPVRVQLQLELPVLETLDVVAQAPIAVELDGVEIIGTRIALPRPARRAMGKARAVSLRTALVAVERVGRRPRVIVDVFFGCGVGVERSIDKRQIKRQVKLATPRMRHCYMREAQRDPTLAGDATLHFAIGRDGSTRDVTIDGSLESTQVLKCLADEVATWMFTPTDTVTQVNYPLTFRLANSPAETSSSRVEQLARLTN